MRGYRLNVKGLPGRPDIAWRKDRLAVFVDGAFWHGHPSAFREGKSGEYWDMKIRRNIDRDRAADQALLRLGWGVLRFWDFEVKSDAGTCVDVIEGALRRSGREMPARGGGV